MVFSLYSHTKVEGMFLLGAQAGFEAGLSLGVFYAGVWFCQAL
jgi:hypothetical protein